MMPGVADTSALPRRHLARQLRQLRREQAGMSLEGVAGKLRWTITKLEDLEHGDIRPHPQDVADLCALYNADEHVTASLIAIATHTQTSPWWHGPHTPDPQMMEIYPHLLEHAERIYEYQPVLVPTLLQTPAYAHIHLADTISEPHTLDKRVAARLEDARLLTRVEPAPPQLIAVLDAVVLRQFPHRPDIMAEQVRHLANLSELPNVCVRIVPFTAGPHPGLLIRNGFTVLDFPEPQGPAPIRPPAFTGDGHPDTPIDTEQYRTAFNDMLDLALDEDTTRDLLLTAAGKHQR